MDKHKPEDAILNELLAELSPEELEPRLEMQLFIDPLSSLTTAHQQQVVQNQVQQT